jgi:hypoxanthine phosphoribosyltransferase
MIFRTLRPERYGMRAFALEVWKLTRKIQVLYPEEQVQAKVRELAQAINRDYAGKELVLVGVLKGSFIFMADLARNVDVPVTCDFLRVASYDGGTTSSGVVRFEFDITQPITGKHALLVEDIVDTGLTMSYLLESLKSRKPASLKVCAFLSKPSRRKAPVQIDYAGFEIPNKFVIGYGLDFKGEYRNLPYVGVLEEEA